GGKTVLAIRMPGARLGVEVEAEAGAFRQGELAVTNRVPAADQLGAPGNVVLGEVLLHQDPGRGPAEMDRRTKGDWTNRAVRGDGGVTRLGRGGDLLAEPQSATVGQVRLHHVAGPRPD